MRDGEGVVFIEYCRRLWCILAVAQKVKPCGTTCAFSLLPARCQSSLSDSKSLLTSGGASGLMRASMSSKVLKGRAWSAAAVAGRTGLDELGTAVGKQTRGVGPARAELG